MPVRSRQQQASWHTTATCTQVSLFLSCECRAREWTGGSLQGEVPLSAVADLALGCGNKGSENREDYPKAYKFPISVPPRLHSAVTKMCPRNRSTTQLAACRPDPLCRMPPFSPLLCSSHPMTLLLPPQPPGSWAAVWVWRYLSPRPGQAGHFCVPQGRVTQG